MPVHKQHAPPCQSKVEEVDIQKLLSQIPTDSGAGPLQLNPADTVKLFVRGVVLFTSFSLLDGFFALFGTSSLAVLGFALENWSRAFSQIISVS